MRHRDRELDVSHAPGEVMSRSETVRSYHSRGEQHVNSTADDFLSTIDAHVDVEMAESGHGQPRSARTSRPVSRPNSAVGPSMNVARREIDDREMATSNRPPFNCIEHAHAPALELELPRGYGSRSLTGPSPRDARDAQAEAMERQPSNVVEFDHHGTPVPRAGLVYHEASPSQRVMTRPRLDVYGHPNEQLAYPHGPASGLREAPAERIHYADERMMPDYPYQAVEYVSTPTYRPERIYDAATGQYYVAERPTMRQYVPVDERQPRVQPLYHERGRTVQYRDIESGLERGEEAEYERYPPNYGGRRYQER